MNGKTRHAGPTVAATLVGALAIGSALYLRPFAATTDPSLLSSDSSIKVERGAAGLAFLPVSGVKSTGFAFYAGAKVPPEAYAYLARACAKAGYMAVLPSFPLGLAVLNSSAASSVFAAYPSVHRWVLGGHSMGGTIAASYAARTKARSASPGNRVAGLLFLAAYPDKGADLSAYGLPTTCISATMDGLSSSEKAARGRLFMPTGARLVEIAGGNHAQFGEYGPEKGDGTAEISGPRQRADTIEETLALLGLVEAAKGQLGSAVRGHVYALRSRSRSSHAA